MNFKEALRTGNAEYHGVEASVRVKCISENIVRVTLNGNSQGVMAVEEVKKLIKTLGIPDKGWQEGVLL